MDGNNNVFVHGKVCGVAYTCTCTSPRFLSNTLISTFVPTLRIYLFLQFLYKHGTSHTKLIRIYPSKILPSNKHHSYQNFPQHT